MRKLGNRRVSVQKMNKKEEKIRKWRWMSLYIGAVAGMTSYFSLVLNVLNAFSVCELAINIIGVVMAVIVAIMMYFSKNYKRIEKIHNKPRFEDVLESFSLSGIFGFIVEKIMNVLKMGSLSIVDRVPIVLVNIILMLLPIGVYFTLSRMKEWKNNVD